MSEEHPSPAAQAWAKASWELLVAEAHASDLRKELDKAQERLHMLRTRERAAWKEFSKQALDHGAEG